MEKQQHKLEQQQHHFSTENQKIRSELYHEGQKLTAEEKRSAFKEFRKHILKRGLFLAPSAIGILIGYVWGYDRTLRRDEEPYRFHDLPEKMRNYMSWGGATWFVLLVGIVLLYGLWLLGAWGYGGIYRSAPQQTTAVVGILSGIGAYFLISAIVTLGAWGSFLAFLEARLIFYGEKSRFGSARWAKDKDIAEHAVSDEENKKAINNIYIGTREKVPYHYKKDGHLVTIAGTRSGKGTNLIMPNLFGKSNFNGSWVVIDPKGEALWHTALYQQKTEKRDIMILNPWGLHEEKCGESGSLNPLDLIKDKGQSPDLVDEARVIAEIIAPISQGDSKNKYFEDRARTLILTMIMHMIVDPRYRNQISFATIFDWLSFIKGTLWEMTGYAVENGKTVIRPNTLGENERIVRQYARQFWDLKDSEKEFGSVISSAQRFMDIFSSPPIAKAMETSEFNGKKFDITQIAKKRTCVYIVIPPEKLKTHSTWLRLMISTCLRAVLKNPGHRVGFILDEFYSLGYLSDIDVGMGAYAGYGITLWPFLQSLGQLKENYPSTWENFLANAGVIHSFGLNDVTTTEYFSKMAGKKTTFLNVKATERPLITQDEARRGSSRFIFTAIDRKPIALFDYLPWKDKNTHDKSIYKDEDDARRKGIRLERMPGSVR